MRKMQIPRPTGRAPIEIGLLNNMPDAALHATERQFASLLKAACGPREVRLRFFSLPEVPRGEYTRTYMRAIYGELDEMFAADLDGLIVTGAEPRAASLDQEPYWERLTQVIDWAETHVAASYWSCLAAHAAVQHLDGVRRVPLTAKCSGVFDIERLRRDPMLAGMPRAIRTPHSRLNGLDEQDLVAHGYSILTRSPEAGVDTFVRRGRGLMVFCQGHPEYDADSLLREYCRDVGRFECGKRGEAPDLPSRYLNLRAQRAFAAAASRGSGQDMMARYNAIAAKTAPRQVWRASAVALFRNWLQHIAAHKSLAARATNLPPPAALLNAQV